MKTLTEFSALVLKNAAKTKQELLAAGKTAEELPAALGEALKLEGDKLKHTLAAVELIEAKKPSEDLKRVIVLSLTEGEKAPHGAELKGEHCYSAEYYPPLHPPKERGRHGKPRRDGGRDGGRDGKKRGKRRGRRDDTRSAGGGFGEGGPKPEKREGRRPDRGPRRGPGPNRPENPNARPIPNAVAPKAQNPVTPASSPAASPADSPATPPTNEGTR